MLSFSRPSMEESLLTELGAELAAHIAWAKRLGKNIPGSEEDYSLNEVIPLWRIPRGVDLTKKKLNSQLERTGWHLQICCKSGPCFYARASCGEDWTIDWIGESRLARDIAKGIDWLDTREEDLPTSSVRLLSSRIFQFSSFIIDELANRHVVVSAASDLRAELPLFGWLTEDELVKHLLNFYGPNYAVGGIARE